MLACVGLVLDPLDESGGDLGKGRGQHLPSRDNDIVVSVLHCKPGGLRYGSLQPAAHAIALHRVAMFLGDGKSDAGRLVGQGAIERLDEKEIATALLARSHGKKLRPALQPPDSFGVGSCLRHSPAIVTGPIRQLSRKTLATACTASNDDLAAALGSHTCTKAVATSANQLRWLIGTLHLFYIPRSAALLGFASVQGALLDARKEPARQAPKPDVRRLIGRKVGKVNYGWPDSD